MLLKNSYFKALLPAKLFLWVLILFTSISCKKEKQADISWTKFSGGTSEDIKSIWFFPSSDTLYICGGKREDNGSVLRSIDNGNSWQAVLESQSISFNYLYFKNTKVGFALGDFLDIYKTLDGGVSWVHTIFTDTVPFNFKVVMRSMEFINDSLAFAVGGDDFGNGIILKTTDDGAHWQKVITEDHELRNLHFIDLATGFACGYGILLKTKDAGVNWEITSLSDEFFTGIYFTDIETGYICGYNGTIYKSIDGGSSWSKTVKGNSLISTKRNHFNCIDFADSEIGIAMGEEGFTLLTQDAGSSWKAASNADKISIQQVKFVSSNSGWAVGDEGAIYKFEIQ